MFGNFSIFFRIKFFIFRNIASYAVGSFSEIITKICVTSFGHTIVFGNEVSGIVFEPN